MLQIFSKQTSPFEAELSASLKELETLITAAAKADGELNMPYPTGDNIYHYFSPFLHKYHDLAAKNRAKYIPQTMQHIVVGSNAAYQVKHRELLNKRTELSNKKITVDATLEHTPEPPKYKKARWVKIAIISLAMLDMGLNIQLFESWGFSLLQSWLFSPFMAVLFAITAHLTPKAFHKITNPKTKKIAAIVFILAATVLFYLLGAERAAYLSEQTGHHHSPLPFTLLSLLFLGVAIALSYLYLPYTEEEKEAIRTYKKCQKDKTAVDKELQALEQQIAALGTQKTETEVNGAVTLETAYINHKRIEAAAKSGLSIYVHANKRHRGDSLNPDCFDKPFDFNFPDFNLKSSNHENEQ